MSGRHQGFPWVRLAFGLCLMIAGTIYALDYAGVLDASDYIRWWPAAFIIFGLAELASRRFGAALIWLVIGTLLILPRLGFSEVMELGDLLDLWPLMIAFAGAALTIQALRPAPKDRAKRGGTFHAFAMMGGNVQKVGSGDFLGGDAFALMAGCEIDLREADIKEEAVIDVAAFWGGIELRVPRSWEVVCKVTPLVGSWEDKTTAPPDSSKRLIVRGTAVMAGVEVTN
ncbi:MAG TPA: DUF5668 domain-containing protein [Thermoanaerobaculia bacterium]|nr:DUF5668 domain-containing protein [Thermoanaerobaculia bacterium]